MVHARKAESKRGVLPAVLILFFTAVVPEAARFAAANFILMFWAGSLMTRHNQWLQLVRRPDAVQPNWIRSRSVEQLPC